MILDTNALSAYVDGMPVVVGLVTGAESLEIPVIALGEYRFGIASSTHRGNYEEWLTRFLTVCRILHITEETARAYAHLRSELKQAGTPIPSNDLWIAALSREHSLPVLSRDRHFDRVKRLHRVGW